MTTKESVIKAKFSTTRTDVDRRRASGVYLGLALPSISPGKQLLDPVDLMVGDIAHARSRLGSLGLILFLIIPR